ncbi:MAG: PEP-CTERM sorting domain-containing protein [Rubripirellula sp.]
MRRLLNGLAFVAIASFSAPLPAAVISEFAPDQPGIDGLQQRIELSGMAGTSFTGFVLGIGGESNRFGTVDTVSRVSGIFDANGLMVSTIGDLLDPSHTIVLVDDYDESAGPTDIDTNDDGVADNLNRLVGIRDAIGISDSTTDLFRLYGSQLGGQDFAFTGDQPQLVFRDASLGAWYAINNPPNGQVFDINANDIAANSMFNGDPFSDSFGAINPSVASAVPEPSTVLAIGSVFAIGISRRRRRQ